MKFNKTCLGLCGALTIAFVLNASKAYAEQSWTYDVANNPNAVRGCTAGNTGVGSPTGTTWCTHNYAGNTEQKQFITDRWKLDGTLVETYLYSNSSNITITRSWNTQNETAGGLYMWITTPGWNGQTWYWSSALISY